MNIQVLDCTLRDGGYYGRWDFDELTVHKYLAAISKSKVDVVEIGFRFLSQEGFLGPFAYSTDEYLNSLQISSNISLAVMINAKELIDYKGGIDEAINVLFVEKQLSPVDIVRVATLADNIDESLKIASFLNKLGYRVFLNVMQIDLLDVSTVSGVARRINDGNCVEVVYFADSFGSMDPESIIIVINAIKKEWSGLIGIHAHDNKGQALINSIAAINNGVNFIDATLLGIGRGAGNTKTENLLIEIIDRDLGEYFPDALFPLILKDFNMLQKKYGWGSNIYYFLSAIHGIHPTYIQEMLGDERYGTEHILSAINFLKSTSAPFYSRDNMKRATSGITGVQKGTWSAENWSKDRDVLIIGAGSSTKRYINALRQYVERTNPIVLCLNINQNIPAEIITAYVACHETRILIESDYYSNLEKPLIVPLSRVPEAIQKTLTGLNILDYGLRVESRKFEIAENGCILSGPLALMYAISVVTAGGAKRILLAGMDGYELADPRQKEITDMLQEYMSMDGSLEIISVTPTTYPVQQHSIYEPNL